MSIGDILHLLRSDWSDMALIQVKHPCVILFLCLISLIYLSIYFLSDASPIHTFPSTVPASKNYPKIGNIISLCSSCTGIWSRCFCLFTRVPLILTNNESFKLGRCITWGWFSIQECNSLTIFRKFISS